ncbi:CBS domain containing-hemolysin-like protein [Leucobacter exalbidus]|uniref:CBS domain containing-hemolysin-like protein n=1 Tax=Leucobacter exalbidus TaxID=662960 RepID=A0A940T437_9MICO|nr:hemolysin family protein [Leucobacter exalbidus]MBP1326822.1 CBS domain containing-hemolysin-like protein [Leucobacter exalbidus]
MNEYLPGLIWLVVLLVVNAFFVGAEFAVISARRSQIEPRAAEGSKAAKTTLWAMEHATLMLATSQLGITVCSLVILNVSEPAIHHLLEYPLLAWTGLTAEMVSITAFVVALLLVTFLHVVFGEMVPKNLAFSVPDRAALLLAPPLVFVSKLVSPVIKSLNWVANMVLRLFGVTPKDEATSAYTLDQVATIVEQSTREGTLEDTGGTLSAAFEFTEKRVSDVAVPLSQIVQLPLDVTPRQVQQAVSAHGYSRYVLQGPDGSPARYLHIKDILVLTTQEAIDAPVPAELTRALPEVSRADDLEDAMDALRARGVHIAGVRDAAAKITGVLFLEDIIEELVGEVQDTAHTM